MTYLYKVKFRLRKFSDLSGDTQRQSATLTAEYETDHQLRRGEDKEKLCSLVKHSLGVDEDTGHAIAFISWEEVERSTDQCCKGKGVEPS